MEKWYQKAELIICRITHAFTNNKSIIYNIAAGKHNTFWEACRTRSILHVYNIFRSNFAFNLVNDLNINMLTEQKQFWCRIKTAVFFWSHKYNIFQIWKTLRFKAATLIFIEFRNKFLNHAYIVRIFNTVGKTKSG